MKNDNNQLRVGSILSYLQIFINIIISLLYTPFMIDMLGPSEYGLYSIASSTIAMLSVLSLGFNSGYIRYYSKYKAEKDETNIAKLNGLYLIIFTVIGMVALICGTILIFNIRLIFKNGLTAAEYSLARKLMVFIVIDMAISFPMGVLSHIITAHEKFIFLKSVGMIKSILNPLIIFPLLLMGYRSIALVTVTLFMSVVTYSIQLFYVIKVLCCRFIFHGFPKGIFWEIFSYTGFVALNIFVRQFNGNIDRILLGRYVGTREVAIYTVGHSVFSYYHSFSSAIAGVYGPYIHRIANSTKDVSVRRKEFTDVFVKVGRIQFLILSLICTGFIFFGQKFIELWVGNSFDKSYYVAVILLVAVTIPYSQNIGIEIQRSQVLHKFRSIAYSIMAIFNFIISVYLCQIWGAIGSTVGTAISWVFANILMMNIYYHKRCNIDMLAYWKNIFCISRGFVIPIVVGVLYKHFTDCTKVGYWALGIVVYATVYIISAWFLSMNEYEKEIVIKPLKTIKSKVKKN